MVIHLDAKKRGKRTIDIINSVAWRPSSSSIPYPTHTKQNKTKQTKKKHCNKMNLPKKNSLNFETYFFCLFVYFSNVILFLFLYLERKEKLYFSFDSYKNSNDDQSFLLYIFFQVFFGIFQPILVVAVVC